MATNNDRSASVARSNLATSQCACISTAALLLSTPALARAESDQFDIAAQPLPAALRVFSAQADMQLLYEYDTVASATGNAVCGTLNKQTALAQLLRNTRLEVVYSSENAATIRQSREAMDDATGDERERSTPKDSPSPIHLAQADSSSLSRSNERTTKVTEEVIVTAQRREERLLDVPIAVTVLPAESLEAASISYTRDLSQLTPGLFYSSSGQYATITVRGISTEQTSPGSENNVAVYLDGAYLPSKISGIFEFPDISSIEVLKGPQGTLYGRNATGGALLFRTKDPSFNFGGNVSVGYGRFNDRVAKAFVTGPLVDGLLAGSLSAYYQDKDGYQDNLVPNVPTGGVESNVVRGKLMLTPTEDVSVVVTGYYVDREDRDSTGMSQPNGSRGVLIDPNAIVSAGPHTIATGVPAYVHNKTKGTNLRVDIDTSYGDLNSTTAYTEIDSEILSDGTYTSAHGTRFFVNQPESVFSQDVSFASKRFGRFQFLSGASYFHDVSKFRPVLTDINGLFTVRRDVRNRTRALAGFIEGDAQVTDRLNLIAGLRYTHENKSLAGSTGATTLPPIDSESWDRVTPRASIKYKLADETNVYATYSRGFKSGQYNSSTLSPLAVKPEDVDAFEVGIKSNVNPSFSINASAFYYDYKNIQVSVANPQDAFSALLMNAAAAEIYGLDIDATYKPTDDLTLRLAVAPLHAEYSDFPNASVTVPRPLSQCPPAYRDLGCGNVTAFQDLTGKRLPKAPSVSGSLSIDYVLHPKIGDLSLNANLYMTDKFYWVSSNRLAESAYHVLNARVTWEPRTTPFSFSVWGRNLTNEDYAIVGGGSVDSDNLLWAPPRSVGLTASMSF